MTECSVCLEDVDHSNVNCVTLPCNHVFHAQCIEDWRNQQQDQQEITCPNCRHGVQQESMQEIMRPFEYLDLVLIPVMLIIWVGQAVVVTFPLKVANKVGLWITAVHNFPYRDVFWSIIPYTSRKLIAAKEQVVFIANRSCNIALEFCQPIYVVIANYTYLTATLLRRIINTFASALGRTIVIIFNQLFISPSRILLTWLDHLLVSIIWRRTVPLVTRWIAHQATTLFTALRTILSTVTITSFRILWNSVQWGIGKLNQCFIASFRIMRNCVQFGIGILSHFLSVIVWRGCVLPISHSLFHLLRFVATCIEYSITVLGNVFAFYGLLAFEYGSEFLVGTVWPALVRGMEKMKSGIMTATRATLNCLEIIWSQFFILLLARILQILLVVAYFTIDGILATIYFAGRCIKLAFRISYTTMRVIYLTLEFTTILFSRTLYRILETVVQAMAAISIGVLTVMTYAWRALQIILGLGFTLFDVTVVIPIVHILHWLLVTGVSIFRAVRVWLATESEFGRWIKQQLRGVRYYFIAGLYNLQFLLRVAIGGSLLLTMLGLTFLVDHAYMLCTLLYSFSARIYNFVVYIAAFIAWCASSFYLYFVTPAFEVIGKMIDMLFVAVYNSVLFIAFCVRAIYNYFAWITRVSGNALVALAQMGWLWIKDRTVKGYHFFKPPVLRMIGWARNMWQISKTLLSSSFLFFSSSLRASFSYIRARWSSFSVAVSRTLRSVAGSCVRAMGVVRDMVRSALGPVRALAANVKERYREVKGRVGERWRNMKQKMGEKWRNMKQRMGERWREMKQRMGTVKEAAGERWRRTKQRVQGSFNYAKERVNMAKANVQQQWKQMKDKMKQRWERIKLMFQMYKVMTKRRMREVKERASTSWRRARGLLVTSEVQT